VLQQIIEFYLCAKLEPSGDISSRIVFAKVSDGKGNVRDGPPYCGYQTGTCSTCGSWNLPRAAYTCHLLTECPTIQHECRLPDRPHRARISDPTHTWTPIRERGAEGDHAARQVLFTCSPCERAQLYRQEKRAKPREGGNWSSSYLCRPSRKRPEKREKNCRLLQTATQRGSLRT